MKKRTVALISAALLIGGAVIAFKIQYSRMVGYIDSYPIEQIDLYSLSDGIYEGSFKYFLVDVSVDVTVKNHTITEIAIVRQKCGKGYEAHDTIDRILKAQQPKVDATTGATGSSKGISCAVYNALSQ